MTALDIFVGAFWFTLGLMCIMAGVLAAFATVGAAGWFTVNVVKAFVRGWRLGVFFRRKDAQ